MLLSPRTSQGGKKKKKVKETRSPPVMIPVVRRWVGGRTRTPNLRASMLEDDGSHKFVHAAPDDTYISRVASYFVWLMPPGCDARVLDVFGPSINIVSSDVGLIFLRLWLNYSDFFSLLWVRVEKEDVYYLQIS